MRLARARRPDDGHDQRAIIGVVHRLENALLTDQFVCPEAPSLSDRDSAYLGGLMGREENRSRRCGGLTMHDLADLGRAPTGETSERLCPRPFPQVGQ